MSAYRTKESSAERPLFDSPKGTSTDDAAHPHVQDDDKPSGIHRQLGTAPRASSYLDVRSDTRPRKAWEIVEEFDHEGHRYRLQRRRIGAAKDTPLARREEETLELASEGMNRKQIAKRLGLAPSTVGVLLHRASIKLRARSRDELLTSYRELTQKVHSSR
jgi:DNA-binding CsgD family transcriptional regulator